MRFVETQIFLLIRFRRLKKVILKETNKVRAMRLKKRVLFSTKHIQCFLYRAIQHTTSFVIESFDFIVKSKLDNEFRHDYEIHVCVFLNLIRRYFLSMITINKFLAFSIIMNVYLSRMHDKRFACSNDVMLMCFAIFDSQCLFRSLYKQHYFRTF